MRAGEASLPWPGVVGSGIYAVGAIAVPLLAQFGGLCLFYRLAPRRPTRFAEVWVGARQRASQ